MVPLQYVYFIGCILTLIPWSIFYICNPKLRKQILTMSLLWTVYGVTFEFLLWTKDWVQPQTLTNTIIGIEDFILAFSTGGIATSVFYLISPKIQQKNLKLNVHYLLIFQIVLMLMLFYILNMSSANATNISLFITALILFFFRKDLIFYSLITGLMMLLGSVPFYYLLMFINSDFVNSYYQLNNLSGEFVTGIPVEDLLFYFLVGVIFGPYYKLWKKE